MVARYLYLLSQVIKQLFCAFYLIANKMKKLPVKFFGVIRVLIMIIYTLFSSSFTQTSTPKLTSPVDSARTSPVLPDSIPPQTATPILSDSINHSERAPRNNFYALGIGGSYGSLGLKVGRYLVRNNRLQSVYFIGGVGVFPIPAQPEYKLGLVMSVGRRYYFPDVFFVDCRAGVRQYVYKSDSFFPVPELRLLGGVEARGRLVSVSLSAGISQNFIFDGTTTPVIELDFLFGNFKLPRIKPTKHE
jgi:hypothetical protein